MSRMVVGSFSMKLPSSSGFISAGMAGSVAATTTMLRIASAKTFQYGTT